MLGVLLHVIGDAVNNLGVMIAALIIWLTEFEARYYADPGASLWIAFIIILSSLPLRVLFSIRGVVRWC
jgi:zinc transporter 1